MKDIKKIIQENLEVAQSVLKQIEKEKNTKEVVEKVGKWYFKGASYERTFIYVMKVKGMRKEDSTIPFLVENTRYFTFNIDRHGYTFAEPLVNEIKSLSEVTDMNEILTCINEVKRVLDMYNNPAELKKILGI